MPFAKPTGPSAVYLNVLPATLTVSTQDLSSAGIIKLYIGLAMTTLSADKNCSVKPAKRANLSFCEAVSSAFSPANIALTNSVFKVGISALKTSSSSISSSG